MSKTKSKTTSQATTVFSLYAVSPVLAEVVGTRDMTHMEITKRLWEYIKANQCQDAQNRRMINATPVLEKIFGKPQVSMFEMTKLVEPHLTKTEQSVRVPRQTKRPSLINATQSELLKHRLKKIESRMLGKIDPDNYGRYDPETIHPETMILIRAIDKGRLALKEGAELRAAVVELFKAAGANFISLSKAESGIQFGDTFDTDVSGLFIDRKVVRDLEAEFDQQAAADKEKLRALKLEVGRATARIARAIASGTQTGAEVTAMLDEFEQMKFGGE